MLKSLRVKNYILIHDLEMNPDSDLVVITGETGAGKSIILGAIGLLLGQRADTKSLFDQDKKCIIEGVFDVHNYDLKELFLEFEWDYFDECIIRREINPAGRSRAFVNDSPANLNEVKLLGERLLDIHSQNESIQVNTASYQLNIIDSFAECQLDLHNFQKLYEIFSEKKDRLNQLLNLKESDEKDKDYKSFLLKELTEANLQNAEKPHLESELNIAENAETIHLQLNTFNQIMDLSEPSVSQMLKEALSALNKIAPYSKEYESIMSRMESTMIELQDIVNESQSLLDHIDLEPEKLNELRERINIIQRLEAKHHVLEFDELIKIRETLESELEKSLDLDSSITELESELTQLEKELYSKANFLHTKRIGVKDELANQMQNLLINLGIEEAQIRVDVSEKPISSSGIDQINILFSANKGQNPTALKDAASGGEISRVMLAIKYLIADKTSLPTIIFDEIDTGVSGKVANQMGEMFRKIAAQHQVLAITHLPQIAAKGNMHFVVYKNTDSNKTFTEIRKLSREERINEIAQMISGKSDSNSAIESAKELLEHK